MYILGIDPGYAIMGYGVINKTEGCFKPVTYGAVTTDQNLSMPMRLKMLCDGLIEVIEKYSPEEASIEKLFFNTNQKTAIGVGEARGVAILACVNKGIRVFEYTPLQIKQALTGNGRAGKKQMQAMTARILSLCEIPRPDDAADALAAALCHGYGGEAAKRLKGLYRRAL